MGLMLGSPAVLKIVGLSLLLTQLTACVIARPARPSQTESAQGPLAPPVTGSPVVPNVMLPEGQPPAGEEKAGARWQRGYYHWDGVHYVWQRGHWQKAPPNAGNPAAN